MIRCKCGQHFINGCAHSMHKRLMRMDEHHHVVCSDCGCDFLDFTPRFMNCELDKDYHPKTVRCDTCWTKHIKEVRGHETENGEAVHA